MDVDLILYSKTPFSGYSQFVAGLDVLDDSGYMKICKTISEIKLPLEDAILEFLESVSDFNSSVFSEKSELQIGLFQTVPDTVTTTVRISADGMLKLSQRLVSIEVTTYPCSD